MALPIFRPAAMRMVLPPDRYFKIDAAISSQISLQTNQNPLRTDTIPPFLSVYLQDLAQGHLEAFWSRSESRLSAILPSTVACLELLEAIAIKNPQSLSISTILDAVIVYTPTNYQRIEILVDQLLNPQLAADLVSASIARLSSISTAILDADLLSRTACLIHVFHLLLSLNNLTIQEYLSEDKAKNALLLLSKVYDRFVTQTTTEVVFLEQQLVLKLEILDAFHSILSSEVQRAPSSKSFDDLLTSVTGTIPSGASPTTFLVDTTLIVDYGRLFGLDVLRDPKNFPAAQKPKQLHLIDQIQTQSSSLRTNIDLLKTLPELVGSSVHGDTIKKEKGKGKDNSKPEDDQWTKNAITQVLDILPDQDPEFLRYCFSHPSFQGEGASERLVSGLLEGTIPIELSTGSYQGVLIATGDLLQQSIPEPPPSRINPGVRKRENIFNDQPLDISKLRIGKKTDDAENMLKDKSWLSEMKAEIVRRAQEPSDEEDEEPRNNSRRRVEPIEVDDDSEDFDGNMDRVTVTEEGEESEEHEDIETILELMYLENPKLFDRDANTRRSSARAELKKRTGWDDEQLEGWRIMLERNPKKDRILQKHGFSGNRKGPIQFETREDNEQKREHGPSSRGGERGRGGSGSGRGRGRGDPSGNADNSAKDRAWKDKNKARGANHNRKRGHDKKMARGGGPPPT